MVTAVGPWSRHSFVFNNLDGSICMRKPQLQHIVHQKCTTFARWPTRHQTRNVAGWLSPSKKIATLSHCFIIGSSCYVDSLDLGSAAVNEQLDPGDETGVIRSEKQRHVRYFFGLPHAAHRDGGYNPPYHVCRLPADQRGVDRTRTNDVRPDTPVLELRSPGSHERSDGGLARSVDSERGGTLNTCDRAVENDRATIIQ